MSSNERDDFSLLELITPLVRRCRLVLLTALGFAIGTAVLVFVVPPRYTSTTSFVPEAPKESSLSASLGGLANQFGLSGNEANPYSAEFIARVLESRYIREAILRTEFGNRPLLDILEIRGENPGKRLEKGLDRLDGATAIALDQRTGVVSLKVTLEDPVLAAAVANRMVEELNKFNVERRRSQSGEERAFAERRLEEARRELDAAEERLAEFLRRNRMFSEFSLVGVEARRLERSVQLKQEVLVTLSRAYEEARIDEVRDTPVLTVIDRADPPASKSWPRRTLTILGAAVFGTLLGTGLAFLAEARGRIKRHHPAEYHEFVLALREARTGRLFGRKPAPTDVR